mgnify:CR=1 FL=1
MGKVKIKKKCDLDRYDSDERRDGPLAYILHVDINIR